jgi:hypothetical protein
MIFMGEIDAVYQELNLQPQNMWIIFFKFKNELVH